MDISLRTKDDNCYERQAKSLRTNKWVWVGPRGSQDRGLGRPREGSKRFSHSDLTPLWELR